MNNNKFIQLRPENLGKLTIEITGQNVDININQIMLIPYKV